MGGFSKGFRLGMTVFMLKILMGTPHRAYAEPVRYLVKMKKLPTSPKHPFEAHIQSVQNELVKGVDHLHSVRSFRHLGIMVVEGERSDLDEALQANALVEYYEKEVQWKPYAVSNSELPSSLSRAPWFKDVLGLDNDAPDPNVIYNGSRPVLVAVLDTGANLNHPYLQAALSANPGVVPGFSGDLHGANVFTRDGNVAETGSEDHGTHVAGLVKSVRDQAIPDYPDAAAVQLLPIKFIDGTGTGSTTSAIEALEYAAARGAKVINASWGSLGNSSFSQALYDSMLELYHQNIVIAVAAGNAEGRNPNNNDVIPSFPGNFNIPGLMSVASITPYYQVQSGRVVMSDLKLSGFSNFGPTTVDIAAPGGYRDIFFDGSGVYSANAAYPNSSQQEFVRKMGTSMATPIVAGVAAVVRAINPTLTAYEVRSLVMNSAHRTPALSQIQSSSYVDADAAFRAARVAQTRGLAPEPSGDSVRMGPGYGDSGGGLFGGCGLLRDIAKSSNRTEGPFGGNSLGILAFSYAGLVLARRLIRGQLPALRV